MDVWRSLHKISAKELRSRYREIATVLARHGLGWMIDQMGLGRLVPFYRSIVGRSRPSEPYSQPEHLRMALEELGVTYVKLGQILSTRPDLIPPAYVRELSKLQDQAPPISIEEVIDVIEQELGDSPDQLFATFNPDPLASASIGQVHAATLKDGTDVVVKVRRPGVEAQVERDLEVLAHLASLADRHTELGTHIDIEGWVQEFAFILRNELDYTREAHNARQIRQNFLGEPVIHVPYVYEQFTGDRSLVMERLRGVKVSNLDRLESKGYDRKKVARHAVHLQLKMVFEHGFFHADPHPGNFFVLPGEAIGLIDFGMVGTIDESLQNNLLRLAIAVEREDADQMVAELLDLGVATTHVRRELLKRDVNHLLQKYYGRSLGEVSAVELFGEMTGLARKHRLQLPTDLTLLLKVMAMSESLGTKLDPDFELIPFARPYLQRFWFQRFSPRRQFRRFRETAFELVDLLGELPRYTRRLLREVERGELAVHAQIEPLDELVGQLNAAINRLVMSILTGALIVALGLIMLVYNPPGWNQWAGWVFGLSFVLVSAFALVLLWEVWRSR
jgi:ubiquinone biosynthesis protein